MVLLISISAAGTGISPAELSMTMATSAMPRAGRLGLPAKMTSAICAPRSALAPCSPSTQAMASAMFDLPEPLGPTMTLMPWVNSSVVLSAKDLKPRMASERRNTLSTDANAESEANPENRSRISAFASAGDPELRLALGLLRLDLDGFDPGPVRSGPAPPDHRID